MKVPNIVAGLLAGMAAFAVQRMPQAELRGFTWLVLAACLLFIWFPDRINGAFASMSDGMPTIWERYANQPNWFFYWLAWFLLVGIVAFTVF